MAGTTGVIPDPGQDVVYTFNQAFGAGDYLSVTLAYDRPVDCTCIDDYTTGSLFLANPVPDVNIIVQDLNGVSIAESQVQSNLSTTEHIFTHVTAGGQYKIIVRRVNDIANDSTNYGLAWWYGPSPLLAGDYSGDGTVDAADYVLWRKDPANYGGDPGGYDTWRANYGTTPGSGAGSTLASVPEPTSRLVAVMAGLIGIVASRPRSI